ncbi:CoA ester lyase [Acidovorax sp. LjRoot118]|uniref:HpcH/HpaI aldolase/citrate lyase family protein n=1 Tax=Acidovorax sp. LjRoot118 TaxID=3342256 RepID=UPI003ED01B79
MAVPSTHQAMARATAFLFVPATRPERIAKALASGAGAVVVDLEDAVAPDEKAAARTAMLAAVKALDPVQRARLLVRTNAVGTPWHSDDVAAVAACVALGLAGAMLAKAESSVALAAVAQALGPQGLLVPLVESNAGLDALDALAQAPQVVRLAFGHLDFQVDLGLECAADEAELLPVRLALVRASRRAGLAAPVDGVTTATDDLARLAEDTARSRRMGFGGKLCIHPAQVAPVQAAFAPDPAALAWARRVLDEAPAHGGAVFRLDGRMVDAPVLALAARLLARAGDQPTAV